MNFATLVGSVSIRLVALLLLTSAAHAENVVFESTETPPYWSARLPDNGFGGEMLSLLSAAAGVPYSLDYVPVKRFRDSTAPYIVGDPDILTHQQHRAIFPIGVFHSAFYYYRPHHDVIEYHNLRDLRGHTLGVLRGTLEDKAYFAGNGIRVEESDSVESLLRKLKRGRIDFCIAVAGAGRYAIQHLFPNEQDSFIQVIIPGLDRPITIMIDLDSPGGKDVAQRYRRVLEKTLRSPAYLAIVENFYGRDNVPPGRQAQLDGFVRYYANTWGN